MATLLPAPVSDDITRYELEHFDDDDVKVTEEEIEEEIDLDESADDFTEDDYSNCIRDRQGNPIMRIAYQ